MAKDAHVEWLWVFPSDLHRDAMLNHHRVLKIKASICSYQLEGLSLCVIGRGHRKYFGQRHATRSGRESINIKHRSILGLLGTIPKQKGTSNTTHYLDSTINNLKSNSIISQYHLLGDQPNSQPWHISEPKVQSSS